MNNKNLNASIFNGLINDASGNIFTELYIGYFEIEGVDRNSVNTITLTISRKIVNPPSSYGTRLPNIFDKALIFTIRNENNVQVFKSGNQAPMIIGRGVSYDTNYNAVNILPSSTITFKTNGSNRYNVYAYTEYQCTFIGSIYNNCPNNSISNVFNLTTNPSNFVMDYNIMTKQNISVDGFSYMDDVITNRTRINSLNLGVQIYPNNSVNVELGYGNLVAVNTTPGSNYSSSFIVKYNKYPIGFSFEFRKIYNNMPVSIQFEGAVVILNANDYASNPTGLNPYPMSSIQEYLKFVQYMPNIWVICGYT
jgi:hypothetical protein